MRLLKAAKGCTTLIHITNELKIPSVQNKTDEHRQHWANSLDKISDDRIQRYILQYQPKQLRDQGKPRKKM